MRTFLGLIVLAGILAGGCETMDTQGSRRPQRQEPVVVVPSNNPSDPWLDVKINDREAREIREYYSVEAKAKGKNKAKKLPPGLQKKVDRGGELPPGWQKKLVRGEIMDEEVYRQCKPLPERLERRLPPQRDGVITVEVGGKIVRLVKATREIIDILEL